MREEYAEEPRELDAEHDADVKPDDPQQDGECQAGGIMDTAMRTSAAGIVMIKDHEGLRLKAYLDPVGILTIGWGHTGRVRSGEKITREYAEELLMRDIEKAEACIERSVTVPLTQGMFDALVSFIFNLGCGAFRGSSLLRHLNSRDYEKAALQFPRWVHGGGRVLPGLVRRREDERQMFLQEVV